MRGINLFATSAVLAVLGSGCAKSRVQTVPDGPPLSVPAPPSRVVAPPELPLPVVEPPEPPTPVAAAPQPPTAKTPATAPARAPVTAAPPPTPSPEPKPAEPLPRTLRPVPSTVDPVAERRVRDVLARAARDLARVDYRRLSGGGRTQYDQSKRFSDQAETAIEDGNLVFAQTLAEKAATLAAGLSGR